ncbi:MAG: adenylate/guanylate cyclase domain-containing protein [Thermoproteota archaeon]|nr:adenylate/guanylate cyclase domain-containing protein [Thermoproteota archaeon]
MFPSAQDVGQIRARVLHTIQYGLEFDLTTEQCKHFLKRHVNSNTTMVVLFIDINGLTQMSITLPPPKFATIVQVFSQETGLAIIGHGGYVLKYVGDSVIGIFPAEFDKRKACENALNCAKSILSIVRECINPALGDNNLPHITVKVGLDRGPSSVILYGKSMDLAPIDLIGPSISMASKITSAAEPNQILAGQSVYDVFTSDGLFRNKFTNIKFPYDKWNYVNKSSGNIYELYSYE